MLLETILTILEMACIDIITKKSSHFFD